MRNFQIALIGSLLSPLVTGCSGGASAANALVPAGSPANAISQSNASTSTSGTSSVAFAIAIPSVQTQSVKRSLQYISSSTKSASVTISSPGTTAQNTVIACTTTCAATLQVPVGVDTFAISLYDAASGSGNVLATGTATASIVKNQTNKVSITFEGVPANLTLNITPSTWTAGTASSSTVSLTASDAAGNIIAGSQNYANAVTLVNHDTSGATSLTATTITSPASTVTLSYNGAKTLSGETITASDGTHTATADITVATPATPAPTTAPTASASVASHILTYQEGLASNQTTPFGSNYGAIAPYINYALTDAAASPAMRSAGIKTGFYSTVHTICVSQVAGECTPDASQAPASVFATTCNGDKVTFAPPPSAGNSSALIQYQTDPTSPDLATLFNSTIAAREANSGAPVQYDFVFDDNAYVPGDSIGWEQWYDFTTGLPTSPAPYCNYSNAAYISGMQSLYRNASLPVVANAFNTPDSAPAASSAVQYFNGTTNLWGGMFEYIYGSSINGNSRLKESDNIWQSEENTQLAVSNAHRLFIGYEHVGGTDAAGLSERLYVYASLMLAFDPNSIVMAEDGTTSKSGVGVNPEEQLVALQPVIAQPTSISSLRYSGGAYAREFAACYYKAVLIGPCASVVNSSSSATASLPTLSRSYAHTAVISGSGVVPNVDTGTVTFNGSAAPAVLQPQTAEILFP